MVTTKQKLLVFSHKHETHGDMMNGFESHLSKSAMTQGDESGYMEISSGQVLLNFLLINPFTL